MKKKYQAVLDLCEELNIQNGDLKEENGVLKIWGTTKYPYEKNLLWDKIKEIGGEIPTDISADIKVEDETVFARHYVKSGDSLSKIAELYYGNAMKYDVIFEANRDILKNPDIILSGQNLVIPFL